MAKKSLVSKSVNPTKASPVKGKKVAKPIKTHKAPTRKGIKTRPLKKNAAKPVKAPKKVLATKVLATKVLAKKIFRKSPPLTVAKAPKAPKKAAVAPVSKGYTATEYHTFLVEKKRLQDNSNQELKDILRKTSNQCQERRTI